MEVAGSVVITIGGDLSALEAALAKGREQAAAFEAQVSAKLSAPAMSAGLAKIASLVEQNNTLLAKLTSSGTAASATMTKLSAATTETAATLAAVSNAAKATSAQLSTLGSGGAAFTAGTISAKEFAAALEATGGNLSKITPQMLGMAAAEDAVAVSTEAATAAFRGLTEAQIQAFAAQQEGANFNRALNESFGLINSSTKSARDSASVFREMAVAEDAVAVSSRGAAAGMEAVGVASSHAAGLGAGVTREFSVLGAEVARGNFSRIPGSLIVLNERLVSTGTGVLTLGNMMKAFGGLAEVIFNPYVIGFLGLTIGLDLAIKGFDKLTSSGRDLATLLKEQREELDALGAAYGNAAAQAKAFAVGGINSFSIASSETLHGLQLEIASKTKDLTSTLGYQGGFDSSNPFQIYDDFKPFEDAINHLRETAAAGTPDILGFKKMVEDRWALDPNNEALTKSAAELENLVKDALGASVALQQLKIAQDQLRGRGDEGANMIANMISAGNAAAEALKRVEDSAGTQGLTAYARAIANINREFDDAVVKAHASGAALETFNRARYLAVQEESLKSLSEISFDQPIAGANALGAAITGVGSAAAGVKVELGGMAAPIVNITQLFGRAKLDQLIGLESATKQFEDMKLKIVDINSQLDILSHQDPASIFGTGAQGGAADIAGAYNAIDAIFKRYDSGNMSVKAVHDAIEQVRASLVALGGDNASVNAFVNAIVNGEMRVRQLNSDVQQLGHSITTLPNKTVTITVRTQRIGSGTQSLYDVPGGTVGVTRYGGNPGDQNGPSMTAYEVAASGYGSMGGSGSPGTTTVNVTRFSSAVLAAGAEIRADARQTAGAFSEVGTAAGDAASQGMGVIKSLSDSAQSSIQQVYGVAASIDSLHDKTVTIHVRTVNDKGGAVTGPAAQSSQLQDAISAVDSVFRSSPLYNTNYQVPQSQIDATQAAITASGATDYAGKIAASGRQSTNIIDLTNDSETAIAGSFNSGGMIHPGDSQRVSFFKSPDETVGIFTPGQMQALADPQSGFTGTQPTANDNRAWTVLMNVEANTRKTAQLLDDIKTASSASAFGGSSYSGGSYGGVDTGQQDQLSAQYMQVLQQVKANFKAAGIIGRGIIGYGLDGLAASAEEIARNIVYGGASPLGAAAPTSYERDMAKQDAQMKSLYGFNSGGMIAPGDSQEVRFFKSPEETVAIFTPAQMQALQGANQNQSTQAAADQRPIQFSQTNHWNGNAPPSQESLAAVRRATALGFMDAQRAARGR